MKAVKTTRARVRSNTEGKCERECARVVRQLEGSPQALSLVVRIAEKLAGRSPGSRR